MELDPKLGCEHWTVFNYFPKFPEESLPALYYLTYLFGFMSIRRFKLSAPRSVVFFSCYRLLVEQYFSQIMEHNHQNVRLLLNETSRKC